MPPVVHRHIQFLLYSINVFVCCVFLSVTCLILHKLLSRPVVPAVTSKLEYFAANRESFSAIFIGSSRICHGISPAIFDKAMRADGYEVRSFNFGVDGMLPPESFALLDEVLQKPSTKLKWIFMELTPINPNIHYHHQGTVRALWWHDWTNTQFAMREAASNIRANSLFPQLEQMTEHLSLFSLNYLHLGRGLDPMPMESTGDFPAVENAGFIALAGTQFKSARQREKYPHEIEELKSFSGDSYRNDTTSIEAFDRTIETIKKHRLTLIFVIAPTAYRAIDFLPDQSIPHVTFAFNDPQKFPELYQIDWRFDTDHLNEAGATAFTKALASRFRAYLSQDQ